MNILLIIHFSAAINDYMPVLAQSRITQTQDDILDAAVERFRHFGIGKTTMSEIASDVNMSTANLYRYFKNKEDIAVACSRRCLQDRIAHLEVIVANKNIKADKKIILFFNAILEYTYDQVESNPRINELVNIIAEKYKEVVHNKNIAEQALIRTILIQGMEERIFDISDLDKTTQAMHTATHIFQLPLAMTIHTLESLQNMVTITLELLLNGLYKK